MAIKSKTTQEFIPVQEIRNRNGYGVIVMKDDSLRSILLSNSLNMGLKSSDEQIGILSQFQDFLNSLDFSCQIVVQSRKQNIKPYLDKLRKREVESKGTLMELQIKEYISFIESLTKEQNIMHKQFFIVIPYGSGAIVSSDSFFSKILGKSNKIEEKDFEEKSLQLEQRMQMVIGGLGRCGLKVTPLDTESIIEVFFKTFNPGDETNKELLKNIVNNE